MELAGRIALVTGSGSGIGRATALRLAEAGARVVGADLHAAAAEETAALHEAIEPAVVDVADPESVDALSAEVGRRSDRLDVLVNNAGVLAGGTVHGTSVETWDRVLDVNLRGVYLVTRAMWPLLVASGSGSIVNLASTAGLQGGEGVAAYCVSKAGVVSLTKCTALDGARVGIRCNCVCPAVVETPMMQGVFDLSPDPVAARKAWADMHPLGRFAQPEEIADAILHLASPRSGFVTGTAALVDGGMLAGVWQA